MTEGLTGSGDNELPNEPLPEVRFLHPQPVPPRIYGRNELLSRLAGYQVSSVHFTAGYLQLGFGSARATDAPVLTCEAMPTVTTAAGSIADGQPGYADALRSLIGDSVVDTTEAAGEGLGIEFAQRRVTLRPSAAEIPGPVIAVLSDFADGAATTWQPGSDTFGYLR